MKKRCFILAAIFLGLLILSSCSGEVNYTPPANSTDMAITHYSHSKMIVDGTTYDTDLSILPGGKIQSFGITDHQIFVEDLRPLITEDVQTLIIGTGYSEFVNLTTPALDFINTLKEKGIQTRIISTRKAVILFNSLPKKGILACFHLGC